jgi:hypothetical protein
MTFHTSSESSTAYRTISHRSRFLKRKLYQYLADLLSRFVACYDVLGKDIDLLTILHLLDVTKVISMRVHVSNGWFHFYSPASVLALMQQETGSIHSNLSSLVRRFLFLRLLKRSGD